MDEELHDDFITGYDSSTLSYPAGSLYSTSPGFLNNLNADQIEVLQSLQSWIISQNIEILSLSSQTLHPTLLLLRYLRANKFSFDKTCLHIQSNLKWRQDMGVQDILACRPEEILGVSDLGEITCLFPHWHCGFDKLGRPVMYKQYGHFDCSKLLKVTSIDALMKYHVWEQEACMEMCKRQSLRVGYIVETLTAVIDVKHMVLSQVTRDFLNIVKGIAKIDQTQYPETLGRFFIINTPAVFPLVWRGVRAFLDPVVASKIEIFGCKEDQWKARLDEAIGLENMPSNYGGTLPELNSTRHPYEEIVQARNVEEALERSGKNKHSRVADSQISTIVNGKTGLASQESGSTSSRIEIEEDSLPIDAQGGGALEIKPNVDPFSTIASSSITSGSLYHGWHQEITFLQRILDPHRNNYQMTASKTESLAGKLYGWSTISMARFLTRSILFHMCITMVFIIIASVDLSFVSSSTMESKSSNNAAMWGGILMIFTSCFVEIISFTGYIAVNNRNHALLIVYIVVMVAFTLLLFSLMVLYFFNSEINVLEEQYASHLGRIRQYNLVMGISCLFVILFALLPLLVSILYERRLRQRYGNESESKVMYGRTESDHDEFEQQKLLESKKQLKQVLNVSSYVSMLTAAVMLCYGIYALHYLAVINFTRTVFQCFGLIYCGVYILIATFTTLWATHTRRRSVVSFVYLMSLPVGVAILIYAAYNSFGIVEDANSLITEDYMAGNLWLGDQTVSDCQMTILSQLLVTGVICCFVMMLLVISMVSAYHLAVTMLHLDNLFEKHSALPRSKRSFRLLSLGAPAPLSLTLRERVILFWAVCLGLFSVFYSGTYVIFSTWPASENGSSLLSDAWNRMGSYDSRYITNDGYLVVSRGLLSLVIGPLVLLYAVGMVEKHRCTPILGMIANISLILLQMIYYAIEIHSSARHFDVHSWGFIPAFIAGFIAYIIFPGWILRNEISYLMMRLEMARRHELILDKTTNGPTLWSPYNNRGVFNSPRRPGAPIRRLPRTSSSGSFTTLSMNESESSYTNFTSSLAPHFFVQKDDTGPFHINVKDAYEDNGIDDLESGALVGPSSKK